MGLKAGASTSKGTRGFAECSALLARGSRIEIRLQCQSAVRRITLPSAVAEEGTVQA